MTFENELIIFIAMIFAYVWLIVRLLFCCYIITSIKCKYYIYTGTIPLIYINIPYPLYIHPLFYYLYLN